MGSGRGADGEKTGSGWQVDGERTGSGRGADGEWMGSRRGVNGDLKNVQIPTSLPSAACTLLNAKKNGKSYYIYFVFWRA